MKFYSIISLLVVTAIVVNCGTENQKDTRLKLFTEYFEAVQKKDGSKWNFSTDTVYLWFDSKSSKPITSIKGVKSNGGWVAWDSVMNAKTSYDSIWYHKGDGSVKGYFYEQNDFYDLIGRPPNKTLRTYWFTDNNKINEILIYWIPEENKTSSEFLPPVIAWANQYAKEEIDYLYADETIQPSTENAVRWKALLKKYHHFQ
ncbi:MAG: hypothetical protein RIA63_05570, partial [Cyclobacteriaceae bacterium]